VQTESVVFEEYVDQLMARQDEYAKELRKALIERLSSEKRALKKKESRHVGVVNEAAVNIQKAWRKKRKRRHVLPLFTARDRRIVNIMKRIPVRYGLLSALKYSSTSPPLIPHIPFLSAFSPFAVKLQKSVEQEYGCRALLPRSIGRS
jgi:hypothetical protein